MFMRARTDVAFTIVTSHNDKFRHFNMCSLLSLLVVGTTLQRLLARKETQTKTIRQELNSS